MKSTVIWPWKWRTKFWNVSTIPAFSYDAEASRIRILSSEKIDANKWNAAVERNGALIFNRYEYLSSLTNWDAIVINDYSIILPLPFKRKFGIKYYTTAPFIHRLQLIGNISEEEKKAIIKIIEHSSFFATFYFDKINIEPALSKTNYIISLTHSYEVLQQSFAFNFRSEVKHAAKFTLQYSACNTTQVLTVWKEKYRLQGVNANDIKNFNKLCSKFSERDACFCRCVYEHGNIAAAVILFKDNHRLYNITNYVSEKGRSNSANYFLYNEVMKEFAEQKLIFDFVGSELNGVKEFYRKFRPKAEVYHLYSIDKLKIFRKIYLSAKRMFAAV